MSDSSRPREPTTTSTTSSSGCPTRARWHRGSAISASNGGPGGSMLLSSGVIWRYCDFDRFRRECPGGDPVLQRLVYDRLDEDLEWLRAVGAPVVAEETGNPLTTGLRFDPSGLTAALVRTAG